MDYQYTRYIVFIDWTNLLYYCKTQRDGSYQSSDYKVVTEHLYVPSALFRW